MAATTIERAIHVAEEPYNDMAPWRRQYSLGLFGSDFDGDQSQHLRTKEEMEKMFAHKTYMSPTVTQVLQVFKESWTSHGSITSGLA